MSGAVIGESTTDRIFNVVNVTVSALFLLTILYPLVYILSASISDPEAVATGEMWLWPVRPTWDGYTAVFDYKHVWTGFRNSLIYTIVGTIINVIVTLLVAYPLSRKDLVGKNAIMFLFVFTMMFSGGLIPTYLLVKDLGMLNTVWAMIIPGALSVWNMIITRTYFQTTIPDELFDAAQIDGSNDFHFLFKIIIPLSGPIVAVITLFYAVGHWNQYFNALIYLKSKDLYPLQLVMREILVQNQVDPSIFGNIEEMVRRQKLENLLKYSLIVVTTFPVLLIYPFVQRHFVKGIMIGSLKG